MKSFIWRKIHWSDKSRFLLHMTDCRSHIWRLPPSPYTTKLIFKTCSIRWSCGDAFLMIANWISSPFRAISMGQDIIGTFWKHLSCLTFASMFLDHNARPHSAVPTAKYSLYHHLACKNPRLTEHVCGILGRQV